MPLLGALSSAPIFIDCQAVIELHELELKDSGGLSGIRDRNSLESAVFAPQQLHNHDPDADLVDMAHRICMRSLRLTPSMTATSGQPT